MSQVEVDTIKKPNSKLVFKQGIFKLSESKSISADDIYRRGLLESTEDIFSLFSSIDVRRARDSSLSNIEILVLALISRLFTLRHYRLFSDIKVTLENHAFNYIRVLMRILPFLYKTDRLEV